MSLFTGYYQLSVAASSASFGESFSPASWSWRAWSKLKAEHFFLLRTGSTLTWWGSLWHHCPQSCLTALRTLVYRLRLSLDKAKVFHRSAGLDGDASYDNTTSERARTWNGFSWTQSQPSDLYVRTFFTNGYRSHYSNIPLVFAGQEYHVHFHCSGKNVHTYYINELSSVTLQYDKVVEIRIKSSLHIAWTCRSAIREEKWSESDVYFL